MLKFRTHGKWILAGEHTVLRGGTAIVFPVTSRYLDFEYQKNDTLLTLEIHHEKKDLEKSFWDVLQLALKAVQRQSDDLRGHLKLTSNIPIGAGMGASATLCVSLARWFCELGFLAEVEIYEFAKSLENHFHGKSSGVDVAVALHNRALRFKMTEDIHLFEPSWQPAFYLSYCGKKGETKQCIDRVKSLIENEPDRANLIDQNMQLAVSMAVEAMNDQDKKGLLVESLEMAAQCFSEWDLLSPALISHMKELKQAGAQAVKPTGSGDGGFVLSLWETEKIPESLKDRLIKA